MLAEPTLIVPVVAPEVLPNTVSPAKGGKALGVALLLAALAGPVAKVVAVTVNVYAVPLVKPVTVIGEELPVPVKPPGLDVTV
jgi:hypothetical protein